MPATCKCNVSINYANLFASRRGTIMIQTDVECFKPNPEIIDLTRKIVEQNAQILKMNEQILTLLTTPMFIVNDKVETKS